MIKPLIQGIKSISKSIPKVKTLTKTKKLADIPSYRLEDTDLKNLFEKIIYSQMIQGKSVLGKRSEGIIETGLRPLDKRYLMRETFERNAAEARAHGYSEKEITDLKDTYNNILDNVSVGYYPEHAYKSAGVENYGGFYNDSDFFISINKDFKKIPIKRIVTHEGRHALDFRTTMLPHQEKIINKAYDDLFETIPESEYAKGLEEYEHMKKEKVTTNADSRAVLFDEILGGTMSNSSLTEKNRIIDAIPDDRIFEAVEKANGYGFRYIQRLRDLGKLTPEKAKAFRECMKHVGIIVLGGIGLNSIFKQGKKYGLTSN